MPLKLMIVARRHNVVSNEFFIAFILEEIQSTKDHHHSFTSYGLYSSSLSAWTADFSQNTKEIENELTYNSD